MLKKIVYLFVLISVCGCANLEKRTHKALLDNELDFMDKECSLNGFFQSEPEFFTFKNTKFCSGELEIIHIESISKAESIVDYKITFKAKQRKLKKWLRAYDAMATRKTPSESQKQIKDLITQIATEKRDWVYDKQTVKLNLTENGWVVKDIIR